MMQLKLIGLLVGTVAGLGPKSVPSGIAKSPVRHSLMLTKTGFVGDAQGDVQRHGGPEKAVHQYPVEHYKTWSAAIGAHPLLLRPGAFGENLSTIGAIENDVAVGDVFRLGSATLQVSQGRQPCWKLNERFAMNGMAKQVQDTGMTGWYYRVLEPGMVSPDDELMLIDRPWKEWTIRRIWRTFYIDPLNRDELQAIAALPSLAEGWRLHAAKRLSSGKIESWSERLDGRK
ncbi:MOSC domain-containing protein [Rhizobium rhizophilum]|uniref:MOSC domain-containing protein n=1 Tax=Rhizobium rhizophilum TaxID=1850373 RepID=A0ABY2QS24_9HYPH|nr:MOSC domain-containing protein [Rhizobium rhizophilum]THV12677.1 MOSC domain-containing protein [Rhizobium rhizophilum]